MLEQLADEVIQESKQRGWGYFCFAALTDCMMGAARLKRFRLIKPYLVASSDYPFIHPKKNGPVLDVLTGFDRLIAIHDDPDALATICAGGFSCGYLFASPVREHWFSVILILSKTTKVPTETELIWLQSVMYRFNHYYYDINPWRRGLIAKRPMQILELIHQGYEDKQVAQILKMSHHTVRDRLNDLRASFEGCQELLEKGQTMACNQLEVIGLADDYGIVRPRLGNRNDPDIEVYTKISKSLR